jgi:hypothetical protein
MRFDEQLDLLNGQAQVQLYGKSAILDLSRIRTFLYKRSNIDTQCRD